MKVLKVLASLLYLGGVVGVLAFMGVQPALIFLAVWLACISLGDAWNDEPQDPQVALLLGGRDPAEKRPPAPDSPRAGNR